MAFGAFSVALGVTISTARMAIRTVTTTAKWFFYLAKAVKFVTFGSLKAGLFIARTALTATKIVASGLGSVLKFALVGGFKMVGRAALWMGRALMMNPIGIAVAAIAGGAYLIYKHWDHLPEFFKEILSKAKAAFESVWGWISESASVPIETVKSLWSGFKGWFSDLFPDTSVFVGKAFDNIAKVMTSPIETVKSLWSGFQRMVFGSISRHLCICRESI